MTPKPPNKDPFKKFLHLWKTYFCGSNIIFPREQNLIVTTYFYSSVVRYLPPFGKMFQLAICTTTTSFIFCIFFLFKESCKQADHPTAGRSSPLMAICTTEESPMRYQTCDLYFLPTLILSNTLNEYFICLFVRLVCVPKFNRKYKKISEFLRAHAKSLYKNMRSSLDMNDDLFAALGFL